jgi:hypothetical protein
MNLGSDLSKPIRVEAIPSKLRPPPKRRWVPFRLKTAEEKLLLNLEILVGLGRFLSLCRYVLQNHFVRYITVACCKVPPSPQMSPPKLPAQMRELHQQLGTALALEILHHFTHRQIGRQRHKQWTWSLPTCPFTISTSVALQISRTSSRTRVPTAPPNTAWRYLVIQTKWYLRLISCDSSSDISAHRCFTSRLRLKARDFLPFPEGDIKVLS